jgi:hypothetical protein
MSDITTLMMGAAGAGGGAETDPNFNQTTLLLHGDGTNGAQNNTFLDSSSNTFTITRNGNTTQGTFSPFSLADGEWSNYFDSATPRYITAPNLAPGTNNFSIECWYYATALPQQFTALAGQDNSAANGTWTWRVNSNDNYQLTFVYYNGGFVEINSSATYNPNNGGWYHCLVTRDGTDLRMFMDGVLAAHGTLPGSFNFSGNSANLFIGRAERDSGNINGYISNFRYVRGSIPTAYQTASTTPGTTVFTPPTNSLTAITDTILLTCQSNRFVDNSTSPQTITSVSSSVQPFSPFAPSAAYDPSVNGGSGYFDGSGDYLSATGGTATQMGTGAFTWECWCYITTTAAYQGFIDTRPVPTNGSSTGMGFILFTGTLTPLATTTDTILTSSINVTLKAWTHVALTRTSGGTLTIWVNGVSGGTTSNASDLTDTALFVGGNSSSPHSALVNGYLSNTRITKGADLYTTTFTPPTAPFTTTVPSGTVGFLVNYTNAGIFDNTGKNNLETVGNAQISTSSPKFGTGSILLSTTSDRVRNNEPCENWIFGTGDFTIEGFWKSSNLSASNMLFQMSDTAGGIKASFTNTIALYWQGPTPAFDLYAANTQGSSANQSLSTGVWYHWAVVRSSGTTKMYLDGVELISRSDTYNYSCTYIVFGTVYNNTYALNGNLDEVRITTGVARYTSAFTPPDAPFLDQ